MDRRAVVINASSRPSGLTDRLARAVAARLDESGYRVISIWLGGLDVGYCRGCYACERTGNCAVSDDFDAVKLALSQADMVVFGTPVYMFNVSGLAKTFIDRCRQFISVKPDGSTAKRLTRPQAGLVFITHFRCGPATVKRILAYLVDVFTELGMARIGRFAVGGNGMDTDVETLPLPRHLPRLVDSLSGRVRA